MADDAKTVTDRAEGDEEEPRVFKIATLGGRRSFVKTLAVGTTAIAAGACGSTDQTPTTPNTPATPTPTLRWTLSGRVTSVSDGTPLFLCAVSAKVSPYSVADVEQTDANGNYSMVLTQGGYTVVADMGGTYWKVMEKSINLISNTRLDFALEKGAGSTCTCQSDCACNPQGCTCDAVHYWHPN